ncbi:polysaccharide biosynthesis tyrosine autokinase [bacterium]|nr:polysaccharide biosynthesis tyrosine autokinase [bacterium]
MARLRHRGGFDPREYGKVLVKRRWTVVTFFFIVLTLITLGTFMQAPVYRSTALVQILPEAPNVVEFKEVVALGSRNYWALKEYYETQFRIIRSRQVTAEVIDRLSLAEVDPYRTAKDAPATLADQIDVEPIKNSQLVAIHAESTNPELAMKIANAVAEVYQRQNLESKRVTSRDALDWLSGESHTMRERLEESEKRMQNYMENAQVFSFEERFNIALRNLAKFSEAAAEARQHRIETEALYNKYREMANAGEGDMIPAVMENKLVQELKSELVIMEKDLAELKSKYKEGHPQVQALLQQIGVIESEIGGEIKNTLGSIKAELIIAQRREKEMDLAVIEARAEAQEVSEKEIQFKALQRDAKANQLVFDELQKRAKETEITRNLAANNISIVEQARLPEHHIRPRRKMNVMLGALLGILGGVGLAFFMEYVDNTIKTQIDIENLTDVPFLGIIPSFQSDDDEIPPDDLYSHHNPKSSITESCRAIRTNIIYSSPGRELRSLLVTSAGPQEGKSTTVINMGIIFAQGGRRVCLVDSDLRRPRLHKAFGVDRDQGLTNYVMGEIPLEDAVTQTEIPNLFIVPSGPIPPNPSELLGSERMDAIIEELRGRFDMLIFDSPPVVAVTDAAVLSKRVDGVMLVVKAGKTTTDMFDRALRQMEDVKAHIVGSVLNDFNLRGEGYRYYYYYHYYRSDDGTTPDRRRKKRNLGEDRKSA